MYHTCMLPNGAIEALRIIKKTEDVRNSYLLTRKKYNFFVK
jgi:hypothetical protein